ncbi:MAG TPA: nicotinamide mononucleotide transporter, partial [Acidimicrobiales bacterium]|nr:nicotinamide mononucleotide transporter [Acidimicrobiales bacterium]
KVQNWYFWISADVIYIPLYAVKRLDLTAIVYVLFLTMCFLGLNQWRRAYRDQVQDEHRLTALNVGVELT